MILILFLWSFENRDLHVITPELRCTRKWLVKFTFQREPPNQKVWNLLNSFLGWILNIYLSRDLVFKGVEKFYFLDILWATIKPKMAAICDFWDFMAHKICKKKIFSNPQTKFVDSVITCKSQFSRKIITRARIIIFHADFCIFFVSMRCFPINLFFDPLRMVKSSFMLFLMKANPSY